MSAIGQSAPRESRRSAERLMSTKTMFAKSPVLETPREALKLGSAWVTTHGSEWVAGISDALMTHQNLLSRLSRNTQTQKKNRSRSLNPNPSPSQNQRNQIQTTISVKMATQKIVRVRAVQSQILHSLLFLHWSLL